MNINKMLLILVLSLPMAGCLEGMQTDPEQVQAIALQAEQYQEMVDAIQFQIAEISKLASPEAQAKVAKLQEELDHLQADVGPMLSAIASAEFEGKSGSAAWLAMIQAANSASSPWNPYAGPIAGVLGLIGAVAAAVEARKKKNEAEEAVAKYEAHKVGVEQTVKELNAAGPTAAIIPAQVESTLYNNIGAARATIT